MDRRLKVLLIEEDRAITDVVRLGLTYEGAVATIAEDGFTGLQLHSQENPDIVLLDIMLPKLDGLSVLKRIRERGDTPVIMLTAKDALEDRVAGLNAGADDYMTKPFEFPELIARIHAVLRRKGAHVGNDDHVIGVADLAIDRMTHTVMRSGRKIDLTPKQFEVLELLAVESPRVLSKQQIYETVWGWDYLGNANAVEQHISHIRSQVDNGRSRRLIHTVHGFGYALRDESNGY